MSYIVEVYKVFRSIGAKGPAVTNKEFFANHASKVKVYKVTDKDVGNATSILDRAGLLTSTDGRPKSYKLKVNCKDSECQARLSAFWKVGSDKRPTANVKRKANSVGVVIKFTLHSGKKTELTMKEAIDLQCQLNKLLPNVDA